VVISQSIELAIALVLVAIDFMLPEHKKKTIGRPIFIIAIGFLLVGGHGLGSQYFGSSATMRGLRWGWLFLLIFATRLVFSSSTLRALLIRVRSGLKGPVLLSYIFVAFLFAGLGILYWSGVNAAYGKLAESKPFDFPYCHISAVRYYQSDVVMFYIRNDTDKPLKELQLTISDAGGVSRYLKHLKNGESPTEQGIDAAARPIHIGPLPTILPNTATELRELRRNISERDSWSFNIEMQTDSHLFREIIHLRKMIDGGMAVWETLTVLGGEAPVLVWQNKSQNFPNDFVVE
jgi:hypothetical protein